MLSAVPSILATSLRADWTIELDVTPSSVVPALSFAAQDNNKTLNNNEKPIFNGCFFMAPPLYIRPKSRNATDNIDTL